MELREEVELLDKKVKLLREFIELNEKLADFNKGKKVEYVPMPYPVYPQPSYPLYPTITC